jgi:hypothetical protein
MYESYTTDAKTVQYVVPCYIFCREQRERERDEACGLLYTVLHTMTGQLKHEASWMKQASSHAQISFKMFVIEFVNSATKKFCVLKCPILYHVYKWLVSEKWNRLTVNKLPRTWTNDMASLHNFRSLYYLHTIGGEGNDNHLRRKHSLKWKNYNNTATISKKTLWLLRFLTCWVEFVNKTTL